MYVAAQNGHLETVRLLVDQGAGLELQSNEGVTPLYIAAQKGHLETVRLLVGEGANVKHQFNCSTPLDIAKKYGHQKVVDFFLVVTAAQNKPPSTPIVAESSDASQGQETNTLVSFSSVVTTYD